jgi:hypothetical protein
METVSRETEPKIRRYVKDEAGKKFCLRMQLLNLN